MDNQIDSPVTLRSPVEVVQAVPYLLGYHPFDRLIAIGLAEGNVTVAGSMALDQVRRYRFDSAFQALRRAGVTDAILVGYGPPQQVTPVMDQARADFTLVDIEVAEAVRVTAGRVWSYICTAPQCCPPEGTPVDMAASAVAVDLISKGAAPVGSRDDITQMLAPVTGPERAAMDLATTQANTQLNARFSQTLAGGTFTEAGATFVEEIMARDELPGVDDIAQLGYYLAAPAVVDQAYCRIDTDGARASLPLWIWVTRHLRPPFRYPSANIAAFAAWRSGNGVLADAAVRISIADEPDQALNGTGHLMRVLIAQGIPPHHVPPISSLSEILRDLPSKPHSSTSELSDHAGDHLAGTISGD